MGMVLRELVDDSASEEPIDIAERFGLCGLRDPPLIDLQVVSPYA